MFKNLLITAYRNLFKQKAHFLINIVGLAIGLTSFIFISSYVIHELSYDRWHTNAKNIYRVNVLSKSPSHEMNLAVSGAPMAQALLEEIPEVKQVCRLRKSGECLVSYQDNRFMEDNILYADSSFFKMFDFELISGNPADVLTEPQSIILSESYAEKIFGDEDPIGKSLSINSETNLYVVKGIVMDAPENSHFHYNMIGSLLSLRASKGKQWTNNNLYTYVLLQDGCKQEVIEDKMKAFIEKYIGPDLEKYVGISLADFKKNGDSYTYTLQPIRNIHFKSNLHNEIEANGNIAYINIFSIIALFILVIAIINFVNLSTAKSFSRAKEVGVKKTIGASKKGLILQFIGESMFLTMLAAIVTFILLQVFSVDFNQLIGTQLKNFFLGDINGIFIIIGLFIMVGILAGIYPAFVLASFKPISVLKGSTAGNAKTKITRKVLVVFQFAISIIIIIGAIIIHKQLNYIQSKDLGFNKEQLVVIKNPYSLRSQIETFKHELLQNPNVLDVANSFSLPGKDQTIHSVLKEDDPEKNPLQLLHNRVSLEYPKTLGLELVQGRFFSKEFGTDSSAIIINETAAKLLGYDNPIGKNLLRTQNHNNYSKKHIIGVVKDYNLESLHHEIRPSFLSVMPNTRCQYLIVRLNGTNIKETIEQIDYTWSTYNSVSPFQYYFFDQEYNSLYKTEEKTSQIFTVFSILAIFIACLGLLGLIIYNSAARTKEIGIRKVHGASVTSIIALLSTDVLKLILFATIIAWPISYYAAHQWLSGFADHIRISPLTFITTTLISFLFAWLVISFHTIKVAIQNPVNALRYD